MRLEVLLVAPALHRGNQLISAHETDQSIGLVESDGTVTDTADLAEINRF
jgi:hypothetical protein